MTTPYELVVLDLAGTTVADDGIVEGAFTRAWDRVRRTDEGRAAAETALEMAVTAVAEAQRKADDQTFLFRFVHLGDTEHGTLQDQRALRVRDLRMSPRFVGMEEELTADISRVSDEDLVKVKLLLEGLGEGVEDDPQLQTAKDLLTSASDSLRSQYLPLAEQFGTPSTVAALVDVCERLAVDGITIDEDDLTHGLPVYLSGVEEHPVYKDLNEDDPLYPEKLRERRREALQRHLTMQRERLVAVREKAAKQFEGWSRERLAADIVAATMKRKIEQETTPWYLDEHILRMAQWQDTSDGEWCAPFADLDDLRAKCAAIPGLRDFLLEGIAPFCDREVQRLVTSAPFLAALE